VEPQNLALKGDLAMKRTVIFVISVLALVVGLLGFAGCSHVPAVYTMPPEKAEEIRSDLGTIGVVISSYRVEVKTPLPAKGVAGGAVRGFVVGATVPVMVGAVIPAPGTTFIGLFIAPFTAVAGIVYGAVKAPPAEEVERALAALEQATARVRAMNLRVAFTHELVTLGSKRTGLTFVELPGIGPRDRDEVVRYDQLDIPGIDTVLEVRNEKNGLRGSYSIDPPSDTYVEGSVRLIRVKDNNVLLEETIFCASEAERKLVEWTENEGQLIVDEFISCVQELAEKIVDDFFLVYPIASR
jgi:hypothetical protein